MVWNQDVAPIREGGTLDERLNAHMLATMGGQVERSYGMFLDLAADETARDRLRDQLLFLGLIDVQDTIVGRKARNTGHKALRARAIVGLADYVGWERAHGVFYTGVPDMAVGPLYYSLYDYICVQLTNAFPDLGRSLVQSNQTPLTPREVEAFVDMLMTGDQDTVFGQLTEHLKNGKSIRSLGDTIQLGAGELILRNTVPRAFTDGQHPFDYCNTGNFWMRTSNSPYQPRILYMMANFVNDSARANKWSKSVIESELAGYDFANRDPDFAADRTGRGDPRFRHRALDRGGACLSAIGRGPERNTWRRSRWSPASSRTIRTTRRSPIRRSRSTRTTRPI